MGRKKPTSTGNVTATGTPIGVNRVVNYICTRLNSLFNSGTYPDGSAVVEPIIQIFGLVDKYEDDKGNKYPVGYNESGGTLTDPINLLPSDRWGGMIFFDYDDPVTFDIPKDYAATSRNFYGIEVKLNMICFFDMKRQKYYSKWGTDYRIQKEVLMQRLLSILSASSYAKGCRFEIEAVYDRSIEQVWKGYSVAESKLKANLQPYYAIRFETKVTFNQSCGTVGAVTPQKQVLTNTATYSYSNQGLMFIVPGGWMLAYFFIYCTNNVHLHIGTSLNGSEILNKDFDLDSPYFTIEQVNIHYPSDQPIYITSPDWTDLVSQDVVIISVYEKLNYV